MSIKILQKNCHQVLGSQKSKLTPPELVFQTAGAINPPTTKGYLTEHYNGHIMLFSYSTWNLTFSDKMMFDLDSGVKLQDNHKISVHAWLENFHDTYLCIFQDNPYYVTLCYVWEDWNNNTHRPWQLAVNLTDPPTRATRVPIIEIFRLSSFSYFNEN